MSTAFRHPQDLRVLHLFANYKWTGPADPAIRTAVETRRLGADVHFAQAAWKHRTGEHRMAKELFRSGLPVRAGLGLRKHFHIPTLVRDRRRMGRWFRSERFDVVHTHLLADHLTAAYALSREPRERRPLLVRHLYDPTAPRVGWREQLAFSRTDGFVVPTRACAEELGERFQLPAERVLVQDPPVRRVQEAIPDRSAEEVRAELGARSGDFLIGITARVQPHRRFELLWEVTRRVSEARPEARVILFGRGNDHDLRTLVNEPVRELGIESNVCLPGYLYDPLYTQALRTLDAFLFLVPGSDGTCRAVREVQALGVPVVSTDRGMLPEMLGPHPELEGLGPSGLALPDDVDALTGALVGLIDQPATRAALSASALARTAGPRAPGTAARRLVAFYGSLAEQRGASAVSGPIRRRA